ncbi:MAG TPA: ADP-ribosylglycohydrolase family protein [Myxococcota bacterium]|nr:ADP-ribosylglycohydrolase family protein [Myxococcota bacterium]
MGGLEIRMRRAWQGRISGCQLGKPVEILSILRGHDALAAYLREAGALPLRDYVAHREHPDVRGDWCRGGFARSEPDDDVNYSFLALLMLEQFGLGLTTEDVARTWLRLLPVGQTFTAERAAYGMLLARGHERFADGHALGFDVTECGDNRYNEWIGAQIRADVYGWVTPGRPALAADLARRDAMLSHRGDGVHGAAFVAAFGAALGTHAPDAAFTLALDELPEGSGAAEAARYGRSLAGRADGGAAIRERYRALSPVHTINNLALVVWALFSHLDDFGAAIGDHVAGLDTDCNGATVGALWALQGGDVPERWTAPWNARVGLSLAGHEEISLDALAARTAAVAARL